MCVCVLETKNITREDRVGRGGRKLMDYHDSESISKCGLESQKEGSGGIAQFGIEGSVRTILENCDIVC